MKKERQTWKGRGKTKLTVKKGALKVFWVDLRRTSSALGEGQSWTSGGTREVLVLPNWTRINRLGEFPYMCIWSVLIFMLYYMNVMPLYDKNLFVYTFLENSQKPPSDFKCAARRRMNINPILGFLWWTAWRQGWLRQAMRILYKNTIFRTFRATRITERNFDTARRQALIFLALGATNFSCLRSFHNMLFFTLNGGDWNLMSAARDIHHSWLVVLIP